VSVVTSVALTFFELDEVARLAEVNQFFEDGKVGLVDVTEHAGGNKAMQVSVAIGAFNYFPIEDFAEHIASIKWGRPDAVRLFVNFEHEEHVHLYEPWKDEP
jgi:hypothetical protein